MLQKVKSTLQKDLVLYTEDHHPNHVACYCPRFFLRGLCTTWDDPSVFKSLEGSPAHQLSGKQRCWMKFLRTSSDGIPGVSARVRSCHKAQYFSNGKTVHQRSNDHILFRIIMQQALGASFCALTLIVKTLYADNPGLLSMPQLWQAIHNHWSSSRNGDEADVEWNDDSVGFFNAVPRADILKAVHCIVKEYSQQTGHTVLAIDLLSKSGHPGQPRGKTKSSLKRVWIQDLPSIVELSFSTGVFTAAGKCRLQVEGTCIGNQISPILSGLPVLLAEREFLSSLPAAISSSLLFLRYVDNRLILGPKTALQSQLMQQFCDPHFYQGIVLERVSDHQWLGFTIDAAARTATFNMPEQPWQIRSPASAGSWKLATSGYFSRASLIRQYAWPPEAIPARLRADSSKSMYRQDFLRMLCGKVANNELCSVCKLEFILVHLEVLHDF